MLRIIKLIVGLGCLGGFVWWSLTATLGGQTLFGHIRAIGKSKEAQELVRGTKHTVEDWSRRLGLGKRPGGNAPTLAPEGEGSERRPEAAPATPPQDRLTEADRKEIRRLIKGAQESR